MQIYLRLVLLFDFIK